MQDKVQRQDAIRRLIGEAEIATQDELRRALARDRIRVNQATLSRDLADLGVRKHDGRYVLVAEDGQPAAGPDLSGAVREFVPCGPHLIVMRTTVGQAQPVGLAIDRHNDPAVFATIAGDDTIFIATRTRRTQAVALRRLTQWFGDKHGR